MQFSYFSKNGEILPSEQAAIPLSNIEYSYGFGVYENLKVRHGIVYFVTQHIGRLLASAQIIGLTHEFTQEKIAADISGLLEKLDLKEPDNSCNVKMLLIGGREPQLFIQALAPHFPDRKLYSEGAKTITVHYERQFPNAKTLNMLPSYLAYKKAKEQECYDALLVSQEGLILEGTRTNFFAMKGAMLFTAPKEDVLEGVTRQTVIAAAKKAGFNLEEKKIPLSHVHEYDGAFLTSTSSKIVPIRQIDDKDFQIPEKLKELMQAYDTFLKECHGQFII